MPKFFVTTNQIEKSKIKIKDEDVKHIRNVLRAKIDDYINICDYQTSKNYKCQIEEINEQYIICNILEEKESEVEPEIKVTILQGLPKSDKMELVIQKAIELGAFSIIPLEMKRCVVKLKEKDRIKKIQRWQKIAEGAAKQSGRDIIPEIKDVINVEQAVKEFNKYDIILVAYENEKENMLKNELKKILNSNRMLNIAIIIGPEGGIEEEEIEKFKQNGAKIISLGKRILRTETVALNVLSIIMYELEDGRIDN